MVLTLIDGNIGSGKTLLMSILAKNSKKEVFSNYNLKIGKKVHEFTYDILTDKDKDFGSCDVFIDESWTLADSRRSNSDSNLIMTYIMFQSRKKGLDLYLTNQLWSSFDLRFKQLCHLVIECKAYPNSMNPSEFRYKFIAVQENKVFQKILPIELAEPYFKIYDTTEVVKSENLENLELNILSSKKIEEYAKQLRPKFQKFMENNAIKKPSKTIFKEFLVFHQYYFTSKSVDKLYVNVIYSE